jgi:hypothetical protein
VNLRIAAAFLVGTWLAGALGAAAQTPLPTVSLPPQHSLSAKLRHLNARLEQRHASGITGTVTAEPHGAQTLIRIQTATPPQQNLYVTVRPGSDCADMARRAATTTPLRPISGGVSSTLVSIPFSAFGSGHFVVDVRNATARAQQAAACARL